MAAGSTPQAPAVGAATTRPMHAFTSATASAAAIMREKDGPSRDPPWPSHRCMRAAPPWTRPLRETCGAASPRSRAWRITRTRSRIMSRSWGSGRPVSWTSRRMKTSDKGMPASAAWVR